ncbi:glucose 1-dehydrogenase [Crenobacter sp. SG2303]|uniref:Glucose 1-dehydrogenase n=1 Tax=Crenobacter oryzisoli TaxID=3056844 RepID=A0ABT7XUI0_9NEIS|nr:glucose 1-dehydrogenase [Crenobacter sp. SG2303]MDN0077464.1 glucose 1-dehydrogenase [Crenobacter sp. SG2303]
MTQQANGRVAGKVALITGGASGVGREDALLLAREGARVVITDVNTDAGQALASEIGDAALFVRHDIASEADWQRAMELTLSRFGRLDVLVNNAAILQLGSIEDTTLDQWRRLLDINAAGYFLGCQSAVKAMKGTGGGSIVNMSSLAGIGGMSMFCAYSASKGAVAALTRSVAAYCKRQKYHIRCNSIHPDGIKTPMVAALAAQADPSQMSDSGADPLARMCEPVDVANVVLFLASDESRWVNGLELRVDNGFLMTAD